MLSRRAGQPGSIPGSIPKPKIGVHNLSSPAIHPTHCKYLMNDIARDISRIQILNSLLVPPHGQENAPPGTRQPQVLCSCLVTDSRLDDELSVAVIAFSDTPKWLRDLNCDPHGFPKKTTFGTLWRGVEMTDEMDEQGQTDFIRAVIGGDLIYAEMLAEFEDTDVNVQDEQGRTALHWACANNLRTMVMLCLSVPGCDSSLKDKDGLTAFDISLQNETGSQSEQESMVIPNLFYRRILEVDKEDPQTALLQLLTISSEPAHKDKPVFPGAAIFGPIRDRNSPLVIALINRGIDLYARNKDGDTALHVAAAQVKNAETVTMLLEAGSDINAIGSGGTTALHRAAAVDHEVVQVLLQGNADVTIKDTNEKSPLHWAAQNSQLDAVRLLLHHGADVGDKDKDGRTALQLVEGSQDSEADLLLLLKEVTDVGNRVVLDPPVQVQQPPRNIELKDERGMTALLQAVRRGDLESVVVLLWLGADMEAVDLRGMTALHLAAKAGYSGIVNALVVRGAQIEATDHDGWTGLHFAVWYGQTEVLNALLAFGAQIEAVTGTGCTALHLAAYKGQIETLKELLTRGAKIEAVDDSGWTGLHLAARYGQTEALNAFLSFGAQIEAVTGIGRTALHLAVEKGQIETLKELLTRGAKIEAVDQNGWTGLHFAARYGQAEALKEFLAGGALVNARSSNGTALQIASKNGYDDIAAILVAAGAQSRAARFRHTLLHPFGRNDSTSQRSSDSAVVGAGNAVVGEITLDE